MKDNAEWAALATEAIADRDAAFEAMEILTRLVVGLLRKAGGKLELNHLEFIAMTDGELPFPPFHYHHDHVNDMVVYQLAETKQNG